MSRKDDREYVADAWFIEVYGKVMATFRTKAEAQDRIATWPAWQHPYLTHGPAMMERES